MEFFIVVWINHLPVINLNPWEKMNSLCPIIFQQSSLGFQTFSWNGRKSYLLHFFTATLANDLGDVHSVAGSNIKAEPHIIIDALVLDVSSQDLGAAAAYSCFDQPWADSCFLCMGKQQQIYFPRGGIWRILHVRTLGGFPPHVLCATGPHLHKESFYTEKLYRLNKVISQIPIVNWHISVHGCTYTPLVQLSNKPAAVSRISLKEKYFIKNSDIFCTPVGIVIQIISLAHLHLKSLCN